jgi:hypothetical protein
MDLPNSVNSVLRSSFLMLESGAVLAGVMLVTFGAWYLIVAELCKITRLLHRHFLSCTECSDGDLGT